MLVVGGFGGAVVPFLFYMVLLSYVRSVRYLSVRRPDQTFLSQLVTFALAPVSSLFNVYLCSMLQYVGLVTCLKTGWSTRAEVEVSL